MKFELDEEQVRKFKEWDKKHREKCDSDAGAIGGRLSFVFTPTGMGPLIHVECLCGEEINLTDSEDW